MKKNIEVVNIDMSVIQWILDFLEESEDDEVQELFRCLNDMREGKASSLLIETGEPAASFAATRKMKFGNLSIQADTRRVTESGKEISLTPKEFDILYFLAGHCGQVFTKEQIYSEVWETSYCMDDSNIMAFIRKLRKMIEPNPDSPIYILTVWGIGYKFNDRL